MVVDVFLYMFWVGLGLSLGVAVVAFGAWKVYKRSNKNNTRKRKGAF